MKSNALEPNVGGQPTAAEEPKSKKAPCSRVVCPHRNDKHRGLKITVIILIIIEWILLILQIVATQQTLEVAPYSYTAGIMIVSLILFWIIAIIEIAVFSVLTKRTLDDHAADGHGYDKKHWCRLFVIERWSCLARTLAMIGSFIMLWIIVIFLYPEVFSPTGGMVIYHIGSVTSDTAKFFARNPNAKDTSVFIEYRVTNSGDFLNSTNTVTLKEESDYTAFITLNGLTPATSYEWRFNLDDTVRQFKTNPASTTPSTYSFVFGSCFTYNFPWQLDSTGFEHIAQLKPDILNFMGDFIYADVPLYRSDAVSFYRSLYRQNFRNSGVQKTMESIPNYFMWDDHEVINDWEPNNLDEFSIEAFTNAITIAWEEYVGGGNPTTPYSANQVYYFDYDYGDTSFFFLDTRSYRSSSEMEDGPAKTLLGAEQLNQLKLWFLAKNATSVFKFLVSPVGWTTDYPITTDSWGGYLNERNEILDFIESNRLTGTVFLSADSHFAYALELKGPGTGLYEFGASPIDAFDSTLGIPGYYPDPFKPPEERQDDLFWVDIGSKGSISFIGQVEVNTQAAVPFITVNIWNRDKIAYNLTVTIDQMNLASRR
jgi:alkaline phosphatase D